VHNKELEERNKYLSLKGKKIFQNGQAGGVLDF
jgi:hypothetical protein